MRNVEIRVPEAVLKQAQDLALAENMTVQQLLSMAVAEAIGAWANKQRVETNGRMAGRRQFMEMLQDVLDAQKPSMTMPVPRSVAAVPSES